MKSLLVTLSSLIYCLLALTDPFIPPACLSTSEYIIASVDATTSFEILQFTRIGNVTAAVRCYSCQYSEGPGMIGYECVTSPADYTLSSNVVECPTECQTDAQSIDNWGTIRFLSRGCKTKDSGCESGSIQSCVETCDSDLCNDKNMAPSTVSPGVSTTTTTPPTEPPGTRDCYSCVYSYHPSVPPICVDDPAHASAAPTVRCPPSRVCTIYRQWDTREKVIRSFERGCQELQGQNECITDSFFETCRTFCSDSLCNSGDGTLPSGGGGGGDLQPIPPPANGHGAEWTFSFLPVGFNLLFYGARLIG